MSEQSELCPPQIARGHSRAGLWNTMGITALLSVEVMRPDAPRGQPGVGGEHGDSKGASGPGHLWVHRLPYSYGTLTQIFCDLKADTS